MSPNRPDVFRETHEPAHAAPVSADLACTRCQDGPAKVVAVTHANGAERRFDADKFTNGLLGLSVYRGEECVGYYPAGTHFGARREDATLPASGYDDAEPEDDGKGCRCYQAPSVHAHVSDEDGDCLTCGCGQYRAPAEDDLITEIDGLHALVRDILQSLPDTADEAQWRDRAGRLDVCDPDGQPYRAVTEAGL